MSWIWAGSPPPFWRRSTMMASQWARKFMAATAVGPASAGDAKAAEVEIADVPGQALDLAEAEVLPPGFFELALPDLPGLLLASDLSSRRMSSAMAGIDRRTRCAGPR